MRNIIGIQIIFIFGLASNRRPKKAIKAELFLDISIINYIYTS